jgi:hypothetical protein
MITPSASQVTPGTASAGDQPTCAIRQDPSWVHQAIVEPTGEHPATHCSNRRLASAPPTSLSRVIGAPLAGSAVWIIEYG